MSYDPMKALPEWFRAAIEVADSLEQRGLVTAHDMPDLADTGTYRARTQAPSYFQLRQKAIRALGEVGVGVTRMAEAGGDLEPDECATLMEVLVGLTKLIAKLETYREIDPAGEPPLP